MESSRSLNVGVVGATGMVGRELLHLLVKRAFPLARLRLFASARSAGTPVEVAGQSIQVEDLDSADVQGLDVAFFSAGRDTALSQAPRFTESGVVVIDNSSAFREDPSVPLVVPEINAHRLTPATTCVANPNCSTIILALPLARLHETFGLQEVVVSTYQAVSGSGRAALDDLLGQVRDFAQGKPPECRHYDRPIFLNLIPKIGDWMEGGESAEERKMRIETWRILEDDSFPVFATTVRVPVERCHSEAVFVRLKRACTSEEVESLLRSAPGVSLEDLPSPRELACREEVFVGRIRAGAQDAQALQFWVVSDQLWKGAALNAIQIAESLLEKGRWQR